MTDLDDRLAQGLGRLASTAPLPAVDDDLERGRRALRRRRGLLAGGFGAAAVASVALLAAMIPGRPSVVDDPTPAAPSSTPAVPSPAEPSVPVPAPRCVEDRLGGDPGTATQDRQAAAPDLLRTYRAILAEHLDPDDAHLQRRASGEQSGTGVDPACPEGTMRLMSYGTKLAWRVPGDQGLGMLQVEVSDGDWQDAQVRLSHDSWQPRPVDLPGVAVAEVATYDDGVAVVVHRTDGLSIAIDANALFGNNSLTPLGGGIDLSVDDLLVAAADPRFGLS